MLTPGDPASADPGDWPRVRPMSIDTIAATSDVDGAVSVDGAIDALPSDEAMIDDELLVEEISIDGMCGVY